MSKKILIVEDDTEQREILIRALRGNYSITAVSSCAECSHLEESFDLAILDVHLRDGNGLHLMKELKKRSDKTQFIVVTGFGSIDLAVKAVKSGAFYFLTKPVNLEELNTLIEKSLSYKKLEEENIDLKTELNTSFKFDTIIGESKPLEQVIQMTQKVSFAKTTVLLTGESGTGKELFAKTIHHNSPRSSEPFVVINCGAIPENLLESELFGYTKGAFTGALQNRMGRFESAHKGTLFLDEIGDMNPQLQVKLLRVLQERSFERVGGNKTIHVDVRVIAATHVNLEKAVKEGKFREDLYYRLNVFPIKIPPLRKREDDIEVLFHHFIKQEGTKLTGITKEALSCLKRYPWPGNIRELKNLIERLSITKGAGVVDVSDLPEKYTELRGIKFSLGNLDFLPEEGVHFNKAVESFENDLILKALKKTNWNKKQTADLLKMNRTTLIEKMKKRKCFEPPCSEESSS